VNAASALVCTACGEELVKRAPVRTPKIESEASELAALGGDRRVGQWADVLGASARSHLKPGGSPCLRLIYTTTLGVVSEFLPFDTSPGARWHAQRRWNELSRSAWRGAPTSTVEALRRVTELRRPTRLLVQYESGWPRIKATEFEPEAVA
jgi:hypothetical protein